MQECMWEMHAEKYHVFIQSLFPKESRRKFLYAEKISPPLFPHAEKVNVSVWRGSPTKCGENIPSLFPHAEKVNVSVWRGSPT